MKKLKNLVLQISFSVWNFTLPLRRSSISVLTNIIYIFYALFSLIKSFFKVVTKFSLIVLLISAVIGLLVGLFFLPIWFPDYPFHYFFLGLPCIFVALSVAIFSVALDRFAETLYYLRRLLKLTKNSMDDLRRKLSDNSSEMQKLERSLDSLSAIQRDVFNQKINETAKQSTLANLQKT
jgi:hypothetical protein